MLPNEPHEDDTLELMALPPLPPPRKCDVDYRELWVMGRRLSSALDALLGAITGLLIDTDEPTADDETLEAEVARAALRLEDEIPPFGPTEDPFWEWLWIAPPLADNFVEAVSAIRGKVTYFVTELGLSRAQGEEFWSKAYKQFSVAHDLLDNGIAKLECEPDLNRQLHDEARRKLESRDVPRRGEVVTFSAPPATDAPPEATVEPLADYSVRGIVLNFERPHSALKDLIRELDALPKQLRIVSLLGSSRSEPLTEAQPAAVDALPVEAATVEPAPESKAAVEAMPKRLWTRETAEPVVDAYIKKHPHAKQREIARKTGISHGTVGKTNAWIKLARKRKRRKEEQQGPRGALSFTEKIERLTGGTSDPDIAAVLDRCAIDPEYRQALEKQHDEMAADEAQRRSGRRPVF